MPKPCPGAIGAMLVVAAGSLAAHAEPLIIAYPVWVGYGPLFVAQEKGFFNDEGVEVNMIRAEGVGMELLLDDQADAAASTVDQFARVFTPDDAPVCFLALDESQGGDGIVATEQIRGIADLEGKTIALSSPGVSVFYLNVLLAEVGLTTAQLEIVEATAEDAAVAFELGDVDAAATWEPWLTAATATGRGHLLADSSERPGLIVDCLGTKRSTLEARMDDFRALARGWAAAVDYYEAYPEDAIEIMARHVGGWLEDPAAFVEALEGVRFYGREANQAYFGTASDPGAIYGTAGKAIDVWTSIGRLEADVSPADVVGHGIWD